MSPTTVYDKAKTDTVFQRQDALDSDVASLISDPESGVAEALSEGFATAEQGAKADDAAHRFGRQLPVFSITATDTIIQGTYVPATLTITEPGVGVTYEGGTGVRIHGNSTAAKPRKPYKIKLDSKSRLIGMDKNAKKWVLLANWYDPAGINNAFAMEFGGRLLGEDNFTPQLKPIELIVNGTYMGLYGLIDDKGDIGSGRIPGDDPEDAPEDTTNVTIVFEADAKDYEADTTYVTSRGMPFNLDALSEAQFEYASAWIQDFEDRLFSDDFLDPVLGWKARAEIQSIADAYIINEVTKNSDSVGYSPGAVPPLIHYSSYFYWKSADEPDGDGLLHGGPLWDFDLSLGIGLTAARPATGFHTRRGIWIARMLRDPDFWAMVTARWNVLKEMVEADAWDWIDTRLATNEAAAGRTDVRWKSDQAGTWPYNTYGEVFTSQISYERKKFLKDRVAWLDPYMTADFVSPDTPLEDIAGPPAGYRDSAGTTALGSGWPALGARSLYVVYDALGEATGFNNIAVLGTTQANGRLVMSTNSSGTKQWYSKADFASGSNNVNTLRAAYTTPGRHVVAISVPEGMSVVKTFALGDFEQTSTPTSKGTGMNTSPSLTLGDPVADVVTPLIAVAYQADHDPVTQVFIMEKLLAMADEL